VISVPEISRLPVTVSFSGSSLRPVSLRIRSPSIVRLFPILFRGMPVRSSPSSRVTPSAGKSHLYPSGANPSFIVYIHCLHESSVTLPSVMRTKRYAVWKHCGAPLVHFNSSAAKNKKAPLKHGTCTNFSACSAAVSRKIRNRCARPLGAAVLAPPDFLMFVNPKKAKSHGLKHMDYHTDLRN
jgi:hypothetical protein